MPPEHIRPLPQMQRQAGADGRHGQHRHDKYAAGGAMHATPFAHNKGQGAGYKADHAAAHMQHQGSGHRGVHRQPRDPRQTSFRTFSILPRRALVSAKAARMTASDDAVSAAARAAASAT